MPFKQRESVPEATRLPPPMSHGRKPNADIALTTLQHTQAIRKTQGSRESQHSLSGPRDWTRSNSRQTAPFSGKRAASDFPTPAGQRTAFGLPGLHGAHIVKRWAKRAGNPQTRVGSINQQSLEALARRSQRDLGLSWDEADIAIIAGYALLFVERIGIATKSLNDCFTGKVLKKWLAISLIEGTVIASLEHLDSLPTPTIESARAFTVESPWVEAACNMAPRIPEVATSSFLGQFLVAINGFLQHQNEIKLADWIQLEPPFNDQYMKMATELQQAYPKGSEEQLREKCTQMVVAARDGVDGSPSWTPFILFMTQYLSYLRDVDADQTKYLETYELLYGLQQKANSALTHPSLGHMMLPTVVSCAQLLCRLAIGLDKQPELIAHLKRLSSRGGGDDAKETLPERAAELIRQALVTCLNDRNSSLDGNGRPEGKKRGIYKIANVCLKILWQCKKTRNASQIFTNIGNLSPPLAAYPKRERVTYLYYLGRFWFQNNHFYRAHLALQSAYDESPARPEFVKQRRHILIYLITTNAIMGQLPSQALLQRPEATGLYERFGPIIQAIRTGNLVQFRRHLDFDAPHAGWFLHFRVLLQLRNRCEVLVWRSLIRKTFILGGTIPPAESRSVPLLTLDALVTVFGYLHKRSKSQAELSYTDSDFDGADLNEDEDNEPPPSITSVESIVSSLIEQGLMKGFIVHGKQRLHLNKSQPGWSPLAVGFPQPWTVIQQRAVSQKNSGHSSQGDDVPGWKKAAPGQVGTAKPGGGMVINLSGARPVGVA